MNMLTEEEKRLVDNVYYKLKNGGAFLSPTKVHLILRSKGYKKPGLYKIRRYIQSLDDYSLQKPVKRSFKRARVEVSGPHEQYDADLADVSNISKYNDGIRFLLVVIDVFSRFLWVEPLETKQGKDVLEAFKRIVANGKLCKRLRTDAGSEFYNKWIKKWTRDNDIHHFSSSSNTIKAGYAERVILTFKRMIYRFFTKYRKYRYIDKLQDFVSNYNTTPHRSLNDVAPKDVNTTNTAKLFGYMYLRKPAKGKQRKSVMRV